MILVLLTLQSYKPITNVFKKHSKLPTRSIEIIVIYILYDMIFLSMNKNIIINKLQYYIVFLYSKYT